MKKRLFCVAGLPIAHSLSPNLFSSMFEDSDKLYGRISTDKPDILIDMIKEMNIEGLNITTPLKETAVEHLDNISDSVKEIGAANTIVNKNGKLYGYNTDVDGILGSFKSEGINPKGKNIIIIGSGGAGKAAMYALKNFDADIYITNKSGKNLRGLAKQFNYSFFFAEEFKDRLKKANIIINTAPLKSIGEKLKNLTSNQILLNADYRSKFNIATKAKIIGGEKWLVHQAIASYKIFFNKTPDSGKIFPEFKNKRKNKINNKIVLIGMPATGKTGVGKMLSKKVDEEFIDTDEIIEKDYKKSIEKIFADEGEEKFREFEKKLLRELLNKNERLIISIGGGAVIERENRQILKEKALNVWLWSSRKQIADRLGNKIRPLAKDKENVEIILQKRLDYYFELSDIIIPNYETIDKTVNHIKGELS